jgi:uncharacterized UPF0160 family protein
MLNFLNIFNKKKTIIVTHNATFHADDIFSCATLSIMLESEGKSVRIIRTRDQNKIDFADYVVDVGGIHDPARNRFDHHQKGGAGVRDNEIPYAAFGLVWKAYGEKVCGDKIVAQKIEEKLVQGVDANDNGIDTFELKGEAMPYTIQDVFYSFRPSYTEELDYDTRFLKLVDLAKEVLLREIKKNTDLLKASDIVKRAYANAEDKRFVILDGFYPWGETLIEYPSVLYVVFPKLDTWRVECMRKDKFSFENKKPLPAAWAGKRDLELVAATGVKDVTFCHNGRFMIVARTKEAALELVQKALAE